MNTHLVYRRELFIRGIVYILVCLLLGLTATYILKSKTARIVLLCLMVLPIFFIKALMRLFTRKAYIVIHGDRFVVTVYDRKGRERKNSTTFNDVKSYSVQLPTLNTADIKFNLKNGHSQSYSFSTDKKNIDYTNGKELILCFQSFINKFNQASPDINKIFLCPSFYASNKGLTVIRVLSICLITGVLIISSTKGMSSLPFSFLFTVLIIFQLLIKRKRELEYYNLIKKKTIE